ncbi:outer membrane beta-barrel protein [Roseovarius sp. C7]|uniref:outer membrane beta-barrel protein n=1 Tax=Roseovarius sp. C7 TaxID=3398643 RepID=UPI0039F71201
MLRTTLKTLTLCIGLGGAATAQAGDAYFGFDAIGALSTTDFGGVNTAGGFSNNDTPNDTISGVALRFGMRDQWTIGSRTITPEIELAWFDDTITSASFPGLPAPTFFYTTSVETYRLGVNLWTPFHQDALWRAELGAGAGAVHRKISTNDTVVAGRKDDTALYGQVGMRFLRKVSARGSLSLSTIYSFTNETSVPLDGGANGNLSLKTNQLEIGVGYQVNLGS